MPQMMPLNWLLLMLFFSMIFYIIISSLFFSFSINHSNSLPSKLNFSPLNWKW